MSHETAARVSAAVARFQAGTEPEQSFRVLVEEYYRPVKSFFLRRVGSPEECCDLTQDTFLRVYKGLKNYRGEAQFGTWLFRIADRVRLNWAGRAPAFHADSSARRLAVEAHDEDDWDLVLVASGDNPLDEALKKERERALHEAMAELPRQMRRCVMLRVEQDLSYREIATVMRLSVETVKVHLFRARERLGQSLRDAPAHGPNPPRARPAP